MNDLADAGLLTLSDAAVAKAEGVMAVTRLDGSVPLGGGHPLGIYRDDQRVLSGWALTLDGAAPVLLAGVDDGPAVLRFELTNPPLSGALPLETLRLRLRRELLPEGVMRDVLLVRSHARERVTVTLALAIAADLLPMLEVRGFATPRGRAATPEVTTREDGVRIVATGRDGVLRATTVTAAPAPAEVTMNGKLSWPLALAPGESVELRLDYRFTQDAPAAAARDDPAVPDGAVMTGTGAATDADAATGAGAATAGARPVAEPARLVLDDGLHQRVVDRAVADLEMLRTTLDGEPFLAAGIPWFACLFGRDSVIAATAALAFGPDVAVGALRLLARHQGTRHDPVREEQPGKVLHELRAGEALAADLTPVARYYGSVDSTPLWIGLLADVLDWTGDLALVRELRRPLDAALGWLDAQGDWLTYAAQASGGLRNQGWKDSDDGVAFADGTWLEPPVALVEAQGYAIRARREAARLLEAVGEDPGDLRAAADAHAARLADALRLPDGRGFSMGFGADGRPSDAQASNQGHLLWSRALGDDDARAVRDAVTGPELFSGWGVRTLGTAGAGHSPYGYHRGTVWPHDTAIVAAGLRAHGFDAAFDRVAFGLLDAATHAPRHRLPELFAGLHRDECPVPVPHPVACQPQAWAAAAVPWLHTLALGLRPDALAGVLHVQRPRLPPGVDRATLTGLRVGGARVDLRFERADGEVTLTAADVRGGEVTVRSSS